MISHISPTPQKVQMIDRDHMLRLLKNGLEVKAFRFTRQAALAWLASFPGDLEVNLYYVKVLINEGRGPQAGQILEKILKSDPLFTDALIQGVDLFASDNTTLAKKYNGVLQGLGEQPSSKVELPEWGTKLVLISQSIANRQYDAALALLLSVIGDPTHPELADLLHLEIVTATEDAISVLNLARLYHSRWPDCLQISLILAKSWMETGNDDEAVNILHQCAASDAVAQVPVRLWGKDFPYRPLYPDKMEIVSNFSVPAEVAGKLGMNQLAAGATAPGYKPQPAVSFSTTSPTIPDAILSQEPEGPVRTEVSSFDGYKVLPTEDGSFQEHPKIQEQTEAQKRPHAPKSSTIQEVEDELRRVAASINQPVLTNTDNRFPAYVILSMKKGLENQYGTQSTQVILDELQKLATVIQEKNAWSSI